MDECQDIITKVVTTQWPGLSKGDSVVLASEEYFGNLLSVIDSSLSFITNHSAYGFRKEETGQSAYISYPKRSVLEGVVNAIAHRNYYMQGTQIEINIFKDRLEITSPGSLLGVRLLKKRKISHL